METLQISKENAIKAFDEAGDKTKKVLSNLFGAKVFQKDVTERVKTFADALAECGETPEQFRIRTGNDSPDEIAYKMLKVITQALNGGEVMDYKDTKVYKYFPWFNAVGSPAGFSFDGYCCGSSHSGVGSRLCFKTRELAEHAGKQFESIYRDFMVID